MSSENYQNPRQQEISRRKILKGSVFGAASTWTIPTFLGETFFGLDAYADTAPPAGNNGPITVAIQLSGGNDGLNTVIPYNGHSQRTAYDVGRPDLGISEDVVLPLNSLTDGGAEQTTLGLHPHLTYFQQLWNQEELAIVNGVGYPNPNLSHFTSTDFWHTAQPNEGIRDGWWGRFFDYQCDGAGTCSPSSGVNVSSYSTLSFRSLENTVGLSLLHPEEYRWVDPEFDSTREMEAAFRTLTGTDHPYRSSIDETKASLAYVQRSMHNALISAATLETALTNSVGTFPAATPEEGGFPAKGDIVARSLMDGLYKTAQMIHGGLDTSIYYVHQGGYDTHSDQFGVSGNPDPLLGRHAVLMEDLNAAVKAFVTEIKAQGNWERLLMFSFSEFGRKVSQNGSQGTDHGAGSNLFVTGGCVKPGMYGSTPSLALEDRIKNDSLFYNIDFRRVYRTVLQNWMGVPENKIADVLPSAPLSGGFDPIPFV